MKPQKKKHSCCVTHSKDQIAWLDNITKCGATFEEEDIKTSGSSLFDFSAIDIDGKEVSMSKYKDKICIVVNVASYWGKTKVHYEQFVQLYDKYHDKGLEILAFPCNQFGKQEPKSEAEIKQFAAGFGVKIPIFSKIKVNGKEAHPIFLYLRSAMPGLLGTSVKWNFEKFICNKEGQPVKRAAVVTTPFQMEKTIISLLEGKQED